MGHAIPRRVAACLSGCLLAGGAWADEDRLGERLADAQARDGYAAAVLYSELGQYRLALDHADDAIAQATPAMRCRASAVQLEARFRLDALQAADAPFADAIAHCLAVGEVAAAGAIRITYARALHAEGRTQDAFELLRLHVDAIEASGQARLVADAHALLAELALAIGDEAIAAGHARSAVAAAMDEPLAAPRAAAHRVLHDVALAAGDDATALVHYRLHAEAAKAHRDALRSRDLAYAVARHENGLRAREIALLQERNKALALADRLDREVARRTLLFAGMLATLIALFASWAVHMGRRQRTLQALASIDPATGVSNRRSFLQQARGHLARGGGARAPVAVVLVGLDGFKRFREDHGGVEADRSLAAAAAACRRAFRAGDVVGRIGGDLLAVVLPGCGRFEAARLAEGCLEAMDPRLAAAFGVTDSAMSGPGVEAMLAAADRALHRALLQPRRRVCVFEGEGAPGHASSARLPGDGRAAARA